MPGVLFALVVRCLFYYERPRGATVIFRFFQTKKRVESFEKLIENFREKMQAVEAFSDYGSVAASMVIDQETVEQRRN